jgi:dethiobiotin synthetase
MNIFISANNTGCGKTYTTKKLINFYAKKGYRVLAFKPIETGVENIPEDGFELFNECKKYFDFNLSLEDIVPIQLKLPAAPYVAGEVDFEKILKSYKKLKKECDILLIEGAGGLLVPINDNHKMIDFIDMFDAKLLLVIASKLGMINDFLLNKFYLEKNNIDFTFAINLFDDTYFKISHPFMKQFNPLFIQKDLEKIAKILIGE